MRVSRLRPDVDGELWDSYVGPKTDTVTDLSGWSRLVHDTYRLPSFLLAAKTGSRLVGALSLLEVAHPFFGHYLTTAPFGTDGGLHFDDAATRDLLVAEAKRLADERDVDYMVIRTRGVDLDGFTADHRYRTAVLDLEAGPEAIWAKTLRRETRNQIRRGQKEGFEIDTGPDQMTPFYEVFHAHMRDLGSPAHSQSFYRSIVRHLGTCARFLVLRDRRQVVAGALLFRVNGTASNYHTVALRSYNRRCPNYLLYWTMIEESSRAGCRRFDMGRSLDGSASLRFKRHWGTQIVALSYNYYLRKRTHPPLVDPRNPAYRIPIAVWRRCPLALTKLVGPRLIRGLA